MIKTLQDNQIAYSRIELEAIVTCGDDNIVIHFSDVEWESQYHRKWLDVKKTFCRKYYKSLDPIDEEDEYLNIFEEGFVVLCRRWLQKYGPEGSADLENSNVVIKEWLKNETNWTFKTAYETYIELIRRHLMCNLCDELEDGVDYVKLTFQVYFYNNDFHIHDIKKLFVYDSEEINPWDK